MKVPGVLSIAALGLSSLASAITVSYDVGYDDGNRALTSVSCSDGPNGLITRYGWQNQGNIPVFPNIGGFQGISWNSPQCGNCYSLTYNSVTIFVLVIDHAGTGFNIAKKAMDTLTGGKSEQLGRVDAQFIQVAPVNCKL